MTILPPDADPIATLRTMAAFGMDEGRGIAEICDPIPYADQVRLGLALHTSTLIGLAILCKNPEKTSIPIFDLATRAVEVTMLADWLKARGYEASACRWQRKPASGFGDRDIAWELVTGPAEVPKMPPDAPDINYLETLQRVAAAQAEADAKFISTPRQSGKSFARQMWEKTHAR